MLVISALCRICTPTERGSGRLLHVLIQKAGHEVVINSAPGYPEVVESCCPCSLGIECEDRLQSRCA